MWFTAWSKWRQIIHSSYLGCKLLSSTICWPFWGSYYETSIFAALLFLHNLIQITFAVSMISWLFFINLKQEFSLYFLNNGQICFSGQNRAAFIQGCILYLSIKRISWIPTILRFIYCLHNCTWFLRGHLLWYDGKGALTARSVEWGPAIDKIWLQGICHKYCCVLAWQNSLS